MGSQKRKRSNKVTDVTFNSTEKLQTLLFTLSDLREILNTLNMIREKMVIEYFFLSEEGSPDLNAKSFILINVSS